MEPIQDRIRTYLCSIINSNLVARTRVQSEILFPHLQLFVLGFISEDLYVDRDLLRGFTEKLVNAHGIGGIPVSRGSDVLPAASRPPGAPIRKFTSRASRFPRNALLVQGHLKAVVSHGAVLACDELQDHVFSARVDARHSTAAAESRELLNPSVHVFQKGEIIAAAARVSRRSILLQVFGFRCLNGLYETYRFR